MVHTLFVPQSCVFVFEYVACFILSILYFRVHFVMQNVLFVVTVGVSDDIHSNGGAGSAASPHFHAGEIDLQHCTSCFRLVYVVNECVYRWRLNVALNMHNECVCRWRLNVVLTIHICFLLRRAFLFFSE